MFMNEHSGITIDKDLDTNEPKKALARIAIDLPPTEKEEVLLLLQKKYPRSTQQGAMKCMIEEFLGIHLT